VHARALHAPNSIDKPNIRRIIHYGVPASLEAYYQQAGRAGRDGAQAHCLLLWSPQDFVVRPLVAGRCCVVLLGVARVRGGRFFLLHHKPSADALIECTTPTTPPPPWMRTANHAPPPTHPQVQDMIKGASTLTGWSLESHRRGMEALRGYTSGGGCRHAALVNFFQPGSLHENGPCQGGCDNCSRCVTHALHGYWAGAAWCPVACATRPVRSAAGAGAAPAGGGRWRLARRSAQTWASTRGCWWQP
jgi:hypothetical protein